MSDEQTTDVEAAPAGEGDSPSRVAGGCVLLALAGLAALAVKALVTAAPYVAYFVAGILCTLAVQRARARWGRRGTETADDAPEGEAPKPDIADALRQLVGDDAGVLLTRLRDHLQLPDTKAVKGLLDEAGIPWKAGRTREGNGPSVRREAIPPAPSPVVADGHGEGCCCRSGGNGNGDNGPDGGERSGIRVERRDGGLVIYDLTHQQHQRTDGSEQ